MKSNRFTLERSKELIRKAKQAARGSKQASAFEDEVLTDIGYRNSPLQIVEGQILKNIQKVQQENGLNESTGWSKFIVIVPSIAIREGVYKSFQVTQDHFQELYGHKINPFIYNSGRPQDIESFATDSRISVMIINTQAFNASGADARRI